MNLPTIDGLVRVVVFAAAMIGLVVGTTCLVQLARSDGRVEYCRIVHRDHGLLPVYVIEGHRSWRPDVRVSVAGSAEEAEAQRKALCP